MKHKLLQAFLLMLVVGLLGGCAKPEANMRVLWPPLPDTPRLEWLGVYYSEMDLPRTSRERLVDDVVGNRGLEFFGRPLGIAADGKGRVYVSDADQRVIKVFDFNSRKLESFAGGRRFQDPLGLAVDSRGNLYVAEGGSRRVLVFSAAGKPLFSFGGPDIFEKPVNVALNESLGRIYVSDGAGHKIAVFDLEGEHLFSFGQWGGGDGHLYSPQGLAVDTDHRLFVADQFNARIQVFDADGNFLYKFGERGNREWNFEFPKDLAFDSDGNLHILDVRKAALITYRPDGTLLLFTGGGISDSPVAFGMPMNIWIDGGDRIYITDSLNRRVAQWRYFSEEYLANNPFDERTIQQQVELRQRRLGDLPNR
ncbi:6-bladed beta-propeller [Geoalkalibacter halelectricus]|uniref:6-bladed beta-propeller n=1 Tax=Geoalkalibacter halelectricus TaxID=2847045 RepID=A0ABY5ZQB0_9BACT|nr:6-bladed beta-propeller [Geoalkalibacter halelectricus]MDO3378800.1 6-bladed beta-propeller [Geoalkalibacter halelectricus]UWZ79894.1 6-bladed beta-propeller [Geoalkalibacter halelectricus]